MVQWLTVRLFRLLFLRAKWQVSTYHYIYYGLSCIIYIKLASNGPIWLEEDLYSADLHQDSSGQSPWAIVYTNKHYQYLFWSWHVLLSRQLTSRQINKTNNCDYSSAESLPYLRQQRHCSLVISQLYQQQSCDAEEVSLLLSYRYSEIHRAVDYIS